MTTVNQIKDSETTRQKRNLTDSQKRNADLTKEGVVINTFVKDPKSLDMNDLHDSLVISDNARMPKKLYEKKDSQNKNLIPISLIATGVMGTIALASLFIRRNVKIITELKDPAKLIEAMPRNLSINDETHQAMFQMVQCPTQKTILAGTGVLAISTMAFMGKMFLDGFKDVWVKKREADIQKNLQENLIAVETQSFSGKIQIIRSMLAEKASEFEEYICFERRTPPVFRSFNPKLKFMGKNEEKSGNNFSYFALGALTLGAIVGFGFLAMKNLGKSRQVLETYIKDGKDEISNIISLSNKDTIKIDKDKLKKAVQALDLEPEYVEQEFSKLNWDETEKNKFKEEVIFELRKSTAKADKALGGDGPPKPTFYSHVNDYRAFLYNYLLDTKNPQFKQLFFGITGITAVSYGGKVLGEAVKDVQVKKMNADTELDLQNRLVATELRNFKAKKDAAIEPLCDEFYVQLQRGKPKNELKTIAENILFEVKNGPPFVYS